MTRCSTRMPNRRGRFPARSFSSLRSHVFRNRENVSVRILEPGHFVAAGSGPDPELVLFEETEPLELDPAFLKTRDDFFYPCDLPSEDRELRWLEVGGFRNAHHDSVRIHDESEAVVLDEAQSQHALVKFPRSLGVGRGHKRNDVDGTQHAIPPAWTLATLQVDRVAFFRYCDNKCRQCDRVPWSARGFHRR